MSFALFVASEKSLHGEIETVGQDASRFNCVGTIVSSDFKKQQFPVRIVTAVWSRLTPYAELLGERSWSLMNSRDGASTSCSDLRNLVFSSWANDVIPHSCNPPICRTFTEQEACHLIELAIPECEMPTRFPFFLTNQSGYSQHRVSCQLRMNVTYWSDFPLGLEAARIRESGSNTLARGNVRHFAEHNGPGVGTFIPCRAILGINVVAEDCVIEIVKRIDQQLCECVLHILLPENQLPAVQRGTELWMIDQVADSEGRSQTIRRQVAVVQQVDESSQHS